MHNRFLFALMWFGQSTFIQMFVHQFRRTRVLMMARIVYEVCQWIYLKREEISHCFTCAILWWRHASIHTGRPPWFCIVNEKKKKKKLWRRTILYGDICARNPWKTNKQIINIVWPPYSRDACRPKNARHKFARISLAGCCCHYTDCPTILLCTTTMMINHHRMPPYRHQPYHDNTLAHWQPKMVLFAIYLYIPKYMQGLLSICEF